MSRWRCRARWPANCGLTIRSRSKLLPHPPDTSFSSTCAHRPPRQSLPWRWAAAVVSQRDAFACAPHLRPAGPPGPPGGPPAAPSRADRPAPALDRPEPPRPGYLLRWVAGNREAPPRWGGVRRGVVEPHHEEPHPRGEIPNFWGSRSGRGAEETPGSPHLSRTFLAPFSEDPANGGQCSGPSSPPPRSKHRAKLVPSQISPTSRGRRLRWSDRI